ncbi:MAG: hypothetical protein P9X22_04660 [Candidatus Zapsychrus exili]|nr:hypothetical protein [Candidatus Zapsychrus exili]
MYELKTLLIVGGALLFIGIILPLALIAAKGFQEKPRMGHQKPKSFIGKIVNFVLSIIVIFVLLPSLALLGYNYVKSVAIGKMSTDKFKNSIESYSYQPVIDFYDKTTEKIFGDTGLFKNFGSTIGDRNE